MFVGLLGSLIDSVVKAAFSYFSSVMEKRGLIQQGEAQQHSADLEATVKESADASQIREQVQAMPVSAVDADLERLRRDAASGSH